MNRYTITIPIAGTVCVQVEAESEKEALKKALEQNAIADTLEWEMFKEIVEGNCLHAPQNEIEIIDVEEDIYNDLDNSEEPKDV